MSAVTEGRVGGGLDPAADHRALVDAEADAEGQVRVAEVRLAGIRRDRGGDDYDELDSERVAAEEALATAVRRLQRCRDATVAAAAAQPDSSGPEYSDRISAVRSMQYTNSADWLEQYLVRMWRRQNVQWCAKWFLHGEALTRIEALWRSWEHMRYEGPTAMAVWWRDYADYHLRELTAKSGPFERCNHRTGEHQLIDMLNIEPAPDELRRVADPPGGPGGG